MCSAGLKVMNFQFCTEPIRLFNISNFSQVVKDELAVLQQRAAATKTAETRITYDTLLWRRYSLFNTNFKVSSLVLFKAFCFSDDNIFSSISVKR